MDVSLGYVPLVWPVHVWMCPLGTCCVPWVRTFGMAGPRVDVFLGQEAFVRRELRLEVDPDVLRHVHEAPTLVIQGLFHCKNQRHVTAASLCSVISKSRIGKEFSSGQIQGRQK